MPDARTDLINAWKQWHFKPSGIHQANAKETALHLYARQIGWKPTFLHDTITRRLRQGLSLYEAIP